MPDFLSMTSVGKPTRQQDSMNLPYDRNFLRNSFGENISALERGERKIMTSHKLTKEVESVLSNLGNAIGIKKDQLLSEHDDGAQEIGEGNTTDEQGT
jgi:hypothetical protein